jgi:Uma2 family endonuclease
MSAAPRYPVEEGIVGLRLTAEEYLSLGETQERTELIEGVVVMSPSPTTRHQRVCEEIMYQLASYRRAAGGFTCLFEIDVRFTHQTVYKPDIVAYRDGRLDPQAMRLTEPPDLVVEVLSGNTPLDRLTKRDDYDRFGVGEYWIVHPESGKVWWYARSAQAGPMVERPVMGDTLASASLPGFVLDLRPVRALAAT